MTYLLIVLGIAFSVLMLLQIVAPFFSSRKDQLRFEILDEDLRKIEALASRKVALVQTLRDLEYDFETAKITEEDYLKFKRSCERQAVGVMRRLDAIHGGRDWEDVIEKALQDRLQDPDLEIPSASPGPAPLTCHQCGTPLDEDDLFCSKCGTPVSNSTDEPRDSDDPNLVSAPASASETPTADLDNLGISSSNHAPSSPAALVR